MSYVATINLYKLFRDSVFLVLYENINCKIIKICVSLKKICEAETLHNNIIIVTFWFHGNALLVCPYSVFPRVTVLRTACFGK